MKNQLIAPDEFFKIVTEIMREKLPQEEEMMTDRSALEIAAILHDYGSNNVQHEAVAMLRKQHAEIERLRKAIADLLSGWRYIRQSHGDLYGVGWDRAQRNAEVALGLHPGEKIPSNLFQSIPEIE